MSNDCIAVAVQRESWVEYEQTKEGNEIHSRRCACVLCKWMEMEEFGAAVRFEHTTLVSQTFGWHNIVRRNIVALTLFEKCHFSSHNEHHSNGSAERM